MPPSTAHGAPGPWKSRRATFALRIFEDCSNLRGVTRNTDLWLCAIPMPEPESTAWVSSLSPGRTFFCPALHDIGPRNPISLARFSQSDWKRFTEEHRRHDADHVGNRVDRFHNGDDGLRLRDARVGFEAGRLRPEAGQLRRKADHLRDKADDLRD